MISLDTRIWCYEDVVKQQILCFSVGRLFVNISLDFLVGVFHLTFPHLFSCSTQTAFSPYKYFVKAGGLCMLVRDSLTIFLSQGHEYSLVHP